MRVKIWYFTVIGILLVGAATMFLLLTKDKDPVGGKSVEVSSNLVNGMFYEPGTQLFSSKDVKRIKIQNHNGNTFIKQSDLEEVMIEARPTNENELNLPKYKVTLKNKELLIEVLEGESLNLTMTIPEQIKELDSQSTFGNIRGEIKETNFIRFVTYFGNLIANYENVNPQGEYIFLTNVGEILTIVPEGTELSYQNQSTSGNTLLIGVKENKNAVKFITTVRDAGWIPPKFIGNQSFKRLSEHHDPTPITNKELIEDLEFTIKKMKEFHPHVKEDPTFYEPLFQQAKQKILQATTREDLFLIVNELMVATKDGHSVIVYQNKQIETPIIKWTNTNEMIITEESKAFKRGDKIISIGGKDTGYIMEAAKKAIPAEHDGYVKARINSFLSNPIFLQHFGMLSDMGETNILFDRAGVEQTATIKIKKLTELTPERLFNRKVPRPYEWSIDPTGKYGIFKIDESIPTDMYTRMLQEFFAEMNKKNVPNVFVDLRNGGGGNGAVAFEFFTYLKVDHYSNGSDQITNSKVSNELLFDGNVYVLTSNQTFSAGTDFAKFIQGNGIGKLVGESPGNNASYGGNIIQFNLPNSGIYVQVPTTKNPAPVSDDEQDMPLMVDYPVQTTKESILNNEDMWLKKIEEIVNRN
ncbi:S41 family peptidase [Pseudoneobacillus sp. C159]